MLKYKDNLYVVSCNKCFKAFETLEEPETDKILALAEGLDKTVTGSVKADFLCNQNHTGKTLQLPEGTEHVIVLSCGLGVQTVAGMAKFMNKNVAGVHVPQEMIDALAADKERAKASITGVEITAKIIRECRPYCQGVHIMALGWEAKVPELLKLAGI